MIPADESLRAGVDDRFARPRLPRPAARRRRWPTGRLLGPLLLVAAWFAVTESGLVGPLILPSPVAVTETGWNLAVDGDLAGHLWISLQRAMIGLTAGVTVGASLAILAGLFRWGERLIDANVQILRALPILAMVPLAIVWFGIGEEVKVILVALGVTFPVYLNTHAAICGLDRRFVELSRTLGLTRWGLVRHVILPGALPGFFTGLRFAVSTSWLVLVVAEQINASSGIGFLMTQARAISATDVIVVGLVIYGALGFTSDALVRALERKVLSWRSTQATR